MNLPKELHHEVLLSAEAAYPQECCGLILRSKNSALSFRHVPMRNAQDDLHRQDPKNFPRTSRSAYTMDAQDLLRVHKELRERAEEIFIIYHSHPDQDAMFSREDRRLAVQSPEGEPIYANVTYWVISVKQGKAAHWEFFRWDEQSKSFKTAKNDL